MAYSHRSAFQVPVPVLVLLPPFVLPHRAAGAGQSKTAHTAGAIPAKRTLTVLPTGKTRGRETRVCARHSPILLSLTTTL